MKDNYNKKQLDYIFINSLEKTSKIIYNVNGLDLEKCNHDLKILGIFLDELSKEFNK